LKINTYNETGKNLSKFDLDKSLVGLKQEHKSVKRVHSQVLQNINQRIAFAFDNFYNRLEKGEKPGFPRFKGKNRYDSITYPQSGFSLGKKLYVSKIGEINIVQHRAIEGKIKTLTIRQNPTGKWFAIFCVEQEKKKAVRHDFVMAGIDMGLHHFYADSLGNITDNPRCLRKSEQKLAQVQRKHSRKKKGGKNRSKSRLNVALVYEKISNQRHDFLHKKSRKLATLYSLIAVEKLTIRNMIQNRHLSKSIADVAWRKFLQMLAYKVEETGGKTLKVNPRGTSQYCICGNEVKKTLAVRIHKCNKCWIWIDRDIMSAMMIKKVAMSGTTAGSAESNAWEDTTGGGTVNRSTSYVSMNQESLALRAI